MGENVTDRFARTVGTHSERPALAFHDGAWQTWSYAQLDTCVATLAARLAAHGITTGSTVGIVAHRDPLTLATMLAVLRCGAHHVPLDPSDPPARRQRLRTIAGMPWEVTATRRHGIDNFEVFATGMAPAAGEPTADSPPAYVMFTSGSTGEPRAVVVPHRAIVRLVTGQDFVRLDASRVFLQSIPLWFDASVIEVFGPLLNGGCCVLHPSTALPTPASLRETIAARGVTSACFTAALFHWLIDHDAACLAGLQEIVIGGEALSVEHVRRAHAQLPATQLVNGYGPTENGVQTTSYRIPKPLPAGLQRVPIGSAVRGTQVLVCDEHLQPVPRGSEGELVATGEGLALGYRGDPAATRERFVELTVAGRPLRAYRTGDRVVETAAGVFDFLGRIDEQVKIQGHRIEPGEVEAALTGLAGVQQCRVVALPDPAGQRRLVAYVVLRAGTGPEAIAAAAATALPSFLVPTHFVALPQLPLNANGKLDRGALPSPWPLAAPRPEARRSPRAMVAAAWREALGRTIDAIDVNFFDAGGRSMDAVRLHDLLERGCGRSLDATFVYEFATQARQAKALAGLASPP